MTVDPREGIDADGYLTTGVDIDNIRPPYDAALADIQASATKALGDNLIGLYLYGSVATGQARPPHSDIDLVALVGQDATDTCESLTERLTLRHRSIAHDVAIGPLTIDQLHAKTDAGRAERCFVKHYCIHLTGQDVRPELPRCRPDRALAREFIGDLDRHLAILRTTKDARATGRRLLMAAAVLYSLDAGTWSTAREIGAQLFAQHHPELRDDITRALGWASTPPYGDTSPELVAAALDALSRPLSMMRNRLED